MNLNGHSEIAKQSPQLKGMHILLAEDNELNQLVTLEMIKLTGACVDVAVNGQEALHLIHTHSPSYYDLVLMDLHMPVLDGYGATLALRRDGRYAKLPIIAVTADVQSADRDRCFSVGMNDYMTKPLDVPRFYAALARWRPGRVQDSGLPFLYAEADQTPTWLSAKPQPWQQSQRDKLASALSQLQDLDGVVGLAVAQGMRRLMNRPEFYLRMLCNFVESETDLADTLGRALLRGDHSFVLHRLHSLKGAAANLAIEDVTCLAQQIEHELDLGGGQAAVVMPLLQKLDLHITQLRVAMRQAGALQGSSHLVSTY